MSLKVFNSRSRTLEPFQTKEPGLVRMYVCGPSVYDRSHVGHARSYVAYDAMKRYFLATGKRVLHVQNFTDIEENIAFRAKEAGETPLAYSARLIDAFFEDMDALHVLRADHYPRVSDHLPEMIAMVERLVNQGAAYVVDCRAGTREGKADTVCDVYYDVSTCEEFGVLIGQSVEDLAVQAPTEKGDRRSPLDFAIWKSRDDWGVTWPSPFGDGRPGWHVECTAMAVKHLGADFDLHGGGLDLVYPHHESENALGRAVTGEAYCRYFLHNGFVTVDNRKMSKSLKNFVTVQEILSEHDPEALRVFLLSAHYRAPVNYDEEAIAAAAERLQKWKTATSKLREAAGDAAPSGALPDPYATARADLFAALEDDFHFGRALDALDEAAGATEAWVRENGDAQGAANALSFFREAAEVLGVLWELETHWEKPA